MHWHDSLDQIRNEYCTSIRLPPLQWCCVVISGAVEPLTAHCAAAGLLLMLLQLTHSTTLLSVYMDILPASKTSALLKLQPNILL